MSNWEEPQSATTISHLRQAAKHGLGRLTDKSGSTIDQMMAVWHVRKRTPFAPLPTWAT
jgi:hypothetical protein